MSGPYEPPWLTAKVDRRLAELKAGGAFEIAIDQAPIIMTYLDEGDAKMSPQARQQWERTCDNCGRYCPEVGGMAFYTGHAMRLVDQRQVLMTYGVCDDCRPQEDPNQEGND